jgi:Ras-related protein Rab-4B
VSRSYYRGAAGAICVYDVTSRASFGALPTFLHDARALAGDKLVVLLAGNKQDAVDGASNPSAPAESPYPSPAPAFSTSTSTHQTQTIAPQGRAVTADEAARWASTQSIPTCVEVSALDGSGVEELFAKLARTILTRIELGEIDPDDPASGIQYGERAFEDAGSVRSGMSGRGFEGLRRRRGKRGPLGLGDWEGVLGMGSERKRRRGCC